LWDCPAVHTLQNTAALYIMLRHSLLFVIRKIFLCSSNYFMVSEPQRPTPKFDPMASSSSSALPCFALPNISQGSFTKLEGSSNYLQWQTQFMPALRTYDLMGIVDGSEPCPPQFLVDDKDQKTLNPDYVLWTKRDQFLLSWINVTLTDKVLSTVYGLNTSKQVWSALSNRFASQSTSRIAHIKRQLQSLSQGSKTCTEYLQFAKSLADQLAAVGKTIDDDDLISYVIGGLNSSFNAFVTVVSFTTQIKPLTFDDFQNQSDASQHQSAATDISSFALVAQKTPQQSHPKNKQQWKPTSRPFNSKPSSGFSGQRAPFRSAAPRQNFSTNVNNRSEAISPSNFFNNSETRPPCQICGKTSHQALDCFHRMDYSYQGRHPPPQLAAMVAQSNAVYDDQWYADSGANVHITNELENLSIKQPFHQEDTVAVGNGAGLAIENTGSTTLSTLHYKFHLHNVLHCPTASANLLSIQKFCADNFCYFILTSTHFFIKDLKTHVTLLEGRSENGLYPIRLPRNSPKYLQAFSAMFGIKTSTLGWHFRLGHPRTDVVSRVIQEFQLPVSCQNFNKEVICNSCQIGKSKRQPFSLSTRVSTQPLQLIHSDVWTSPVQSVSGYKFYVIFIDDYSRYTWFYPLVHKSEVFNSFIKFKQLAENQFSSNIKQLQSDGGGEYTSLQFQAFLNKHGIIHRKSCPYTSQQNGLAERKLRHILETGLTLLAHSHLSNRFWVDAFLTAVHIINRLPTPTLDNVSPFTKLHGKDPNYQSMRVFGCKCYPLLRPYNKHKLEYRSKPCIFLGYHYAGYKCLDALTNKVYLSRHVIFDENSFPAKEKVTSTMSSKLPTCNEASLTIPVSHSFPHIAVIPPNTNSVSGSTTETNTQSHIVPSSPTSHTTTPSPHEDFGSPLSAEFISATPQDTILAESNSAAPKLNFDAPVSTEFPSVPHTEPSLAHAGNPNQISVAPSHHMITRSQTGSLHPKSFPDYKMFSSTKYPLTVLHSVLREVEPSSYHQAATGRIRTAASTMYSDNQSLITVNSTTPPVFFPFWKYFLVILGITHYLKQQLLVKGCVIIFL